MTGGGPGSDDPHKTFVKNAITSKPKKTELVEDIKKFIKTAEAHL
jgi:hypothetical protein